MLVQLDEADRTRLERVYYEAAAQYLNREYAQAEHTLRGLLQEDETNAEARALLDRVRRSRAMQTAP